VLLSTIAIQHSNYILIRGSFPGPPLLRFSRRAVDEKDDVVLGIRGARHCGADCGAVGVRKREALKGRNTGRKAERFMVAVGTRGTALS
jgi:hypothetical protein